MKSRRDNLRALALSIGLHGLCLLLMLAGMAWTRKEAPLSVAGSPIEATLMLDPGALAAPPSASRPVPEPPAAPPPQPRPTPPPQQAEAPPQPQPLAPPPRPDTRDAEAAARLALQQAEDKAREEQRERRRQEQLLLEEERRQQEAERRERLRQQQEARDRELAEIRRQRESAERQRRLEADRLQQIADARRDASAVADARSSAPPAQQLGNNGVDDSLLGRYQLAIQQSVQQNWLRPESTRPGIRCALQIVQIPGGEVIQASVSTPCNADELTRRSIEAAVLKAQPLPYRGFESVFRREIRFTFRYDGD